MKIKNTEIEIMQGDITGISVDAIICPANTELKMEKGLAGVLKQKGGEGIEVEAIEKGPIVKGASVVTGAGGLKVNYVIHSVVNENGKETDQNVLRAAIASALGCARDLKLVSVAIAAMGCGEAGFPKISSAKIISQEILKTIKEGNTFLEKIVICLFDQDTFEIFENTIKGYMTHIQDTLGDGPYVTVDIIIELDEGIIVIERSNPPFGYALPGGFVDYGESIETAAAREAKEETNMELAHLRQFHTYSDPKRDPRFHTVSTVFIAKGKGTPQFGDDAKGLKVVKYEDLLNLDYAFDHKKIIRDYLEQR